MATVDPADDSIDRWVLEHFHFDPDRRQRRNVVVAAHDNAEEHEAAREELSGRIARDTADGVREKGEHVRGTFRPAGQDAVQARARLLQAASAHGVDPRTVPLDGPFASNVGFFGWSADGTTWSLQSTLPADPPPSGPRDDQGPA